MEKKTTSIPEIRLYARQPFITCDDTFQSPIFFWLILDGKTKKKDIFFVAVLKIQQKKTPL